MESIEQKFKQKYRTKSHRLQNYDYSSGGGYFLTICCYDKECLFGAIVDGKMVLNELGKIAEKCWCEISEHFPDVSVDEFVVMPNHIHGIIFLNPSVETKNFLSLQKTSKHGTSRTLGSIVRGFKIGVTNHARQKNPVVKIWQSNYHDRIIRNEDELNRIREYIRRNPENWEDDNLENLFM